MKQPEVITLIYAIARKSLEDPSKESLAIKRIVEICEKSIVVDGKKIKPERGRAWR